MRTKHIHIPSDSKLLQLIYSEVEQKVITNKQNIRLTLVFKFLFFTALCYLLYTSLLVVSSKLSFILFYVLYGCASLLFAFNFGHDLSHNTIFHSKKLNHLLFILVYTTVGAHAEAWKQRHIDSHHYAPNVKAYDSDLNITNLIRVIPKSNYAWFHRYQHWYAPLAYTTYSLYWIFIKDILLLKTYLQSKAENKTRYLGSFLLQKTCYIGYLLFIPILFCKHSWPWVLLGFIVMHLVQSFFLLFTFFMTHHVEGTIYPSTNEDGSINTSWIMNQVKSSNDMHPFSTIANFIFGGFNNHIAHHLFPHYHHIFYPHINRILYPLLKQHGVKPNQTSYVGGMRSHWIHLKNLSFAHS